MFGGADSGSGVLGDTGDSGQVGVEGDANFDGQVGVLARHSQADGIALQVLGGVRVGWFVLS